MAVLHFSASYIGIDASDISAECDSVQVSLPQSVDESFLFGNSGLPTRIPTTRDATVTISLKNPDADEGAAGKALKVLYDGSILGGGDGLYTVAVRAAAGATGSTAAPLYSMSMCLDEYSPIMGGPGSLQAGGQSLSFKLAGGAITRTTA